MSLWVPHLWHHYCRLLSTIAFINMSLLQLSCCASLCLCCILRLTLFRERSILYGPLFCLASLPPCSSVLLGSVARSHSVFHTPGSGWRWPQQSPRLSSSASVNFYVFPIFDTLGLFGDGRGKCLELTLSLQVLVILEHVSEFHSFFTQNNFPLYVCVCVYNERNFLFHGH